MTHDPTLASGPEQGAPVPPRWCASCGTRWATGVTLAPMHQRDCKAYLAPHVDPWATLELLPAARAQLDSYLRGTGATPIRDDRDNHVAVVPPEFSADLVPGPHTMIRFDGGEAHEYPALHARAAEIRGYCPPITERGDGYGLNITVGDDAPTLENLLDLADEHIAHIRDVAGRLEEVVAAQREALERLHDALAAFRP